METATGWISIHRKIWATPLWREKRKFSKAEAWIDMLLLARYEHDVARLPIKGSVVTCGRAQIIRSLDTYATRWEWSKPTVRRFLLLLQDAEQIVYENVGVTCRVTIVNYDQYQPKGRETASDTELTRKRHGVDTVNETVENPASGDSGEGYELELFDCETVSDTEVTRKRHGCDAKMKPNNKVRSKKEEEEQCGEALPPTPPKPKPSPKPKPKGQGSRIPDNFPDEAAMAYALERADPDRAELEAEKFRDHWLSVPGGKGVRSDWMATWRNWLRKSEEWGQPLRKPASKDSTQIYKDGDKW